MSEDRDWRRVYDFWFPADLDKADLKTHRQMLQWWMQGGANAELPQFASLLEAATLGSLDYWAKDHPKGRLSLIIRVDQFPRGLFAGTPKAFVFDPDALQLTEVGLKTALRCLRSYLGESVLHASTPTRGGLRSSEANGPRGSSGGAEAGRCSPPPPSAVGVWFSQSAATEIPFRGSVDIRIGTLPSDDPQRRRKWRIWRRAISFTNVPYRMLDDYRRLWWSRLILDKRAGSLPPSWSLKRDLHHVICLSFLAELKCLTTRYPKSYLLIEGDGPVVSVPHR